MQHQEDLEVVVLVDNFDPEFYPLTSDKPWGFNSFHVFRFIDLCLEWVSWLDSPNVVVAFANQSEEFASKLQKKWKSNIQQLQTITVQDCHSINDVLREIEARCLIKGDFILVQNCATFCSSNLTNQIQSFKARRKQNKNNVLSLLCAPLPDFKAEQSPPANNPLIGYHTATNKIVYYDRAPVGESKTALQKNSFLTETAFRHDLALTGIAICALEFSGHFAGNYDFRTFDRILCDVLSNEEFLQQNIHLELVTDCCALSADSYTALLRTHSLLLQRYCFPITFDNTLPNFSDFDRPQMIGSHNIYAPEGFGYNRKTDLGLKDSLFGKFCEVDPTSYVEKASFGITAKIGPNAVVRNSICGDGVRIEEGAQVESSLLGAHVVVRRNAKVKLCIIGAGVHIAEDTILESGTVLMADGPQNRDDETEKRWKIAGEQQSDGKYRWYLTISGRKRPFWIDRPSSDYQTIDGPNDDEIDEAMVNAANGPVDLTYQGNTPAFVAEVLESMQAILEDESGGAGTAQMDKLKLEINASKLAYNIPMDELAKSVFLSFLRIPGVSEKFAVFSKHFKVLSPIWKTYCKKSATRVEMLLAIEEHASENKQFQRIVPNVLHFLSQSEDILSDTLIIDWYETLKNAHPLRSVEKLGELVVWLKSGEDSSDDTENDSHSGED